MASDDSDNESLPDLSFYFKPPKTDISKGDIVWAKYKHLYWPALVRTVYPKQKKITIWYTDEPGKTFKLPLKNVALFHDASLNAKIKKDVIEAGCFKEHDGLTSHAHRYLSRRFQGYQDDPLLFFDQTYPFYLVEDMRKKNPNMAISDMKIPPIYMSKEKKQSIRQKLNSKKNMSDDSEVESTDSENEPEKSKEATEYIKKVDEQLNICSSKPIEKEFVDKIVEFILSGNADDYLKKVLSKKVPSEHRDIYERSQLRNKKTVSSISFTGPIEDNVELRKLIFYLLPLKDSVDNAGSKNCTSKRGRPVRCKRRSTLPLSAPSKKTSNSHYVASVWLPESIIYAISVIKNISLPEAKQLFNEKYDVKTKDLDGILASLDGDNEEEPSSAPMGNKMKRPVSKQSDDTEAGFSVKKKRVNLDDPGPSTDSNSDESHNEAGSVEKNNDSKCASNGEDQKTSE